MRILMGASRIETSLIYVRESAYLIAPPPRKLEAQDSVTPDLRKSVRTVSDDIMGTMVNVLFFTYICGGLPGMLLMLRNAMTMSFVWEYVLSFEMVRFLAGSIGLVLAVPITQLVLRVWVKRQEAAHG